MAKTTKKASNSFKPGQDKNHTMRTGKTSKNIKILQDTQLISIKIGVLKRGPVIGEEIKQTPQRLFLQTKKNWKKTEDWFTNRPLGKDNIKKNFDWLIEQLKETGKLAPEKNYVLHSIRGGTATNMNNGGIDKDRIKARTGHLNAKNPK